MKKRLLIVALVAGMLPTLFSCTGLSKEKRELIEKHTSIEKIVTVVLPNWDSIDTIITESDTIVIFSKYKGGSVIVERKPAKAE